MGINIKVNANKPQLHNSQRHSFSKSIRNELANLARDRNNHRGFLALVSDISMIGIAILLFQIHPVFYPITLITIATRQRGLANLYHESSHYNLAKNRTLNDIIGRLAGWAVFQQLENYRNSHLMHHKYLGHPSKDPDLVNYINQGLFETNPSRLFREHFFPLLLLSRLDSIITTTLHRNTLFFTRWYAISVQEKLEGISFLIFWATIFLGAMYFGLLVELVLLWLIPYLTIYHVIGWLTEIAEHFPLVNVHCDELLLTRNRRGNFFERCLTGLHGEDWHLVHHLHAGLPFWKLREAHDVMMQDPAYREASSLSGGLFTRGPSGEPSILSLVSVQLAAAMSSKVHAHALPRNI